MYDYDARKSLFAGNEVSILSNMQYRLLLGNDRPSPSDSELLGLDEVLGLTEEPKCTDERDKLDAILVVINDIDMSASKIGYRALDRLLALSQYLFWSKKTLQ